MSGLNQLTLVDNILQSINNFLRSNCDEISHKMSNDFTIIDNYASIDECKNPSTPKEKNMLSTAQQNVYVVSEQLPTDTPIVSGVDFNKGRDIDHILNAFRTTGFQATNLAKACDRINEMIHWRLTPEEAKEKHPHLTSSEIQNTRATIFLGLTSNQVSCGTREVIRYLCEHNMIDCLVTTCGAIEEDIMKCFAPHFIGKFNLDGKKLRLKGQNRIGNLIVPNKNYCIFEDWLTPILQQMLVEQRAHDIIWTPSKIIRRLGKEINNPSSVWYWCYVNNIPVYCPAITDGAIGDILYFMSYKDDGFVLDISRDIRLINDIALSAVRSGMIILGGGVVKHHICNANLMRNGADWSVFINTGQEFDGSDSGARPDEAVSWGKIKLDTEPVKVYGDATVMFPFVVAGSFAHPKHMEYAIKPGRVLDQCYLIPQLK